MDIDNVESDRGIGEVTARSRKEALAMKARFYFTGVPCVHGHVAVRRTDSGTCVKCHREASHRQWEKLRDGDPAVLAWHYDRQKAYAKGEVPPQRPLKPEA